MKSSVKFVFPLALASVALLAAPRPSLAQALMIDVQDCVTLTAVLERYACYEEKVSAARDSAGRREAAPERAREAAPADAAPPRPRAPAVADTSEPLPEEFGFRKNPSELEQESRKAAEELHSSIAALEETVPDRFLITLENGQVWRSMTSKKYRLQTGQEVVIYPTTWGQAYRLTVPELRGFIQVERVR